jgi:hypothetical protein
MANLPDRNASLPDAFKFFDPVYVASAIRGFTSAASSSWYGTWPGC